MSGREVERLLSNLDINAFAIHNEKEIVCYAEVMETVFAHYADITLTENHIRQLDRDLLAYCHKDAHDRGA